ncbi:HNH endonuclease [Stenotrophomonas maltophilia]|uniref:HNH endonuclease n=1 Tax=Stenotrophomonas maltophilia TaxID=40324 RepID=UPI00209AB0C8|nr:HNH endonuclease [Stenotrophomonas maltophilia]MCO7473057.1 HNH endonuclease [Stenotrophomonas maltophilia]
MVDLSPFLDAIRQAENATEHRATDWQRRAALAAFENSCAFCAGPLPLASAASWSMVALVPAQLGGPNATENWVPACRPCASRKGLRDLMSWTEWQAATPPHRVSALLRRRQAALLYAHNHLTPLSPHAKRARVLGHLAARFTKPRFRIHAWSGDYEGERIALVGWSTRAGDPLALGEALLTLRFADGGEVVSEGQVTLIRLSVDGYLDAVWRLIESHGIVEEMSVAGGDPVCPEDWRECWRNLFQDPASNHLRRFHGGKQALPHAPRALVTTPSEVARRTRRKAADREEREATAELAYTQARARLARYRDRVRRGLEAKRSLEEEMQWSLEVRELGLAWVAARALNRGQRPKQLDQT